MRHLPFMRNGARGRLLLYLVAFPGAVALDIVTPLGVADWLLEVILVWIASFWGSQRETGVVTAIATLTIIGGMWTSPAATVPFWMGALNRLVATVVMWTIANAANRRRAAEEAQRRARAEIRILQGLLPICAACKSIKTKEGEWQRLESYLTTHSEAQLTHGLCPACAAIYMAQLPGNQPQE